MRKWDLAVLPFLLIFVACAPKQNAAPSRVPLPPEPEASQAKSAESFEEKWEKLVQAARKEGTVVIYYSQPPGLQPFVGLFKERFGVRPETVAASTRAVNARAMSEHRSELYIADIILSGRTSLSMELAEPVGPSLLLPELIEPELIKKVWWRGQLWWVDNNPKKLSSQAAPASLLAINTALIKPGEVKSLADLLNPKWKGQIVVVDPYAGNGLNSLKVVSTQIMSKNWEYAREMAKQEPVFTFDERLQAEWVAKGKYPIAFAPSSGQIAQFQEAGAPIDFLTPEEGNFIGSGSNIVHLIKNQPHPNAARLFINFFLTKEGQTIYTRTIGVHSAREDVPTEGINPNKLRQPGVKYYLPELVTPRDKEISEQIFGHLTKK